MNSNLEPGPHTNPGESWDSGRSQNQTHSKPANWLEALLALAISRVGLCQLEAKAAVETAQRRILKWIFAAVVAFFGWILLLSGAVTAIASAGGWPWFWIALAFAAIHLLLALLLVVSASSPSPPRFQATRAELHKDLEWIKNLISNRKSNG